MSDANLVHERYEVLETLGEGAGRQELRAFDRKLAREVLLVRMPWAADEARSLREGRALAALAHPGVQRLHDAFTDEGITTAVLEPVAGETLGRRLAREDGGRLAADEVRRLGVELADALAAVHAAGAVHRGVSEEAIVLRADGSACLTGFRFAKPSAPMGGTSLDYEQLAEGDAAAKSLPAYPAPEQLGGEAASERSDLFALGCVLYRALTGASPMPDLLELGWQAPTPPSRLVPGVPRELATLITACLARSPIGRPRSAVELREALGAAQDEAAPRARARSRVWIGAAGVLLAALAAWQLAPRPGNGHDPRGVRLDDPGSSSPSAGEFAPGFGRSVALLIGIGEAYGPNGFTVLDNAVADIETIDAALTSLPLAGWETTLLREQEASLDGIRRALGMLDSELGAEDRALIYFAGHGFPHQRSGSSGWVVPADGLSLERDPSRATWLHFDVFERFLKDALAKHVMIAMDCCYGGRMGVTRSGLSREFETTYTTHPARVVLTAGRANEAVSDGPPGGHSPFAEVILEALGDGVPITSSMLHARMQSSFLERRLNQQPVLVYPDGMLGGEFVFLGE